MTYMMLIDLDEHSLSEAQRSQCYMDSAAYAGQLLSVNPLEPTSTATSVRFRDGKRVITDGPFAETREQLGGYFLIEAENLDKAIEIAGEIPAGHWGTVEIRPVMDIGHLPAA